MNFSDNLTSIEAGKPYLVKWGSGDDITSPVFENVTISNVTKNVETEYADFIGNYAPVDIAGEDKSILYLGTNNKLYYPDAAMTINAFRAYFQLNGITAGDVTNAQMFFGDETTTGIRSIDNSQFTIDNWAGAWYDLQGRKVNGQSLKKGLYIVDGKKVLRP
jgi:hypothetical protein